MATAKKATPKRKYTRKASTKNIVNPNNRRFVNLVDEHGSHCTFERGSVNSIYKGRICVRDGTVYICNNIDGRRDLNVNNMGYEYTCHVGLGSKTDLEYLQFRNFRLGKKDTTLPRIQYAAGFLVKPTTRGWDFGCGAVKASVREVRALIGIKEEQVEIDKEIQELQNKIRELQTKRQIDTARIGRLVNSASNQNVNIMNADLEYLRALLQTR